MKESAAQGDAEAARETRHVLPGPHETAQSSAVGPIPLVRPPGTLVAGRYRLERQPYFDACVAGRAATRSYQAERFASFGSGA